MNRSQLGQAIYKTSHLTGNFLLRSGLTSNEYFDKYRFESQPHILQAIAEHILPLLPEKIDALAALEMGGIPVGTALSLKSGIACAFIRKKAKDYGTCQFAEGFDIKGKRLCLIEDVITTGGQVVLSTQDLRNQGAIVEHVICVIYRGKGTNGQDPALTEIGLTQKSLFTMSELKTYA